MQGKAFLRVHESGYEEHVKDPFVGANFFSFCFSFSHLLVIVYSCVFFSLSGISLITLLCYVLYVNFVIVCYLAYLLPVLRVYWCNSIRRSRLFFPRFP